MRTVEVGVEADAGAEGQHVGLRFDHPDASEGAVDAVQQSLGALPHGGIELLRLHERGPDAGVHRIQTGASRGGLLSLFAPGDVADGALEQRFAAHLEAGQQHLGGEQLASRAAVDPLESVTAGGEGRADRLAGQDGRVAAARLGRRREVGGRPATEVVHGRAGEHLQCGAIAVDEAALVEQHEGIARGLVHGAEFGFRLAHSVGAVAEGGDHRVEGGRERPQLVLRSDGHLDAEIPGCKLRRCAGKRAHRPHQGTGRQQGEQQRGGHLHRCPDDEGKTHRIYRGQGLGLVDLRGDSPVQSRNMQRPVGDKRTRAGGAELRAGALAAFERGDYRRRADLLLERGGPPGANSPDFLLRDASGAEAGEVALGVFD